MTTEVTLATTAASISRARNIVAEEMTAAGCADETIDTARLLTSELATNAVRWSAGAATYRVNVRLDNGILRVGVTDDNPVPPVAHGAPAADSESGRGLWMLDLIATTWGVDRAKSGKCVWFEIPC
jgi:anti-sigma regulatory factor (Ser/Thr protein kinase)